MILLVLDSFLVLAMVVVCVCTYPDLCRTLDLVHSLWSWSFLVWALVSVAYLITLVVYQDNTATQKINAKGIDKASDIEKGKWPRRKAKVVLE
jgi:hypothetical protein